MGKIQVGYVLKGDNDVTVSTEVTDLRAVDENGNEQQLEFADVTLNKDNRYGSTEAEFSDPRNLKLSGDKYTIKYKVGEEEKTVTGTIGNPKGTSYSEFVVEGKAELVNKGAKEPGNAEVELGSTNRDAEDQETKNKTVEEKDQAVTTEENNQAGVDNNAPLDENKPIDEPISNN